MAIVHPKNAKIIKSNIINAYKREQCNMYQKC